MKILFASNAYFGSPFVVGSHHLSKSLAAAGHDVLYVSTPISLFHVLSTPGDSSFRQRWRLGGSGPKQILPRLWEWVPRTVFPGKPSLIRRKVNLALSTCLLSLPKVVRITGFDHFDLCLIDQPYLCHIWNAVGVPVEKVVYRPTDLYHVMGRGKLPDFKRVELLVLGRANAVVSASFPVYEHVASMIVGQPPHLLLENGADIEHFGPPRPIPSEYRSIPSPRAVYMGCLDYRFDTEGVAAAAALLPNVSFVLIGDGGNRLPARGLSPNVHQLGIRPYECLPGYLQHADIGLLPLTDHPANAGRSPMKLYEYFAAGLPVVAKETSELSRRRLASLVLYRERSEMAARISALLASPMCRQEIAKEAAPFSWSARTSMLQRFIEEEVFQRPQAGQVRDAGSSAPLPTSHETEVCHAGT